MAASGTGAQNVSVLLHTTDDGGFRRLRLIVVEMCGSVEHFAGWAIQSFTSGSTTAILELGPELRQQSIGNRGESTTTTRDRDLLVWAGDEHPK